MCELNNCLYAFIAIYCLTKKKLSYTEVLKCLRLVSNKIFYAKRHTKAAGYKLDKGESK